MKTKIPKYSPVLLELYLTVCSTQPISRSTNCCLGGVGTPWLCSVDASQCAQFGDNLQEVVSFLWDMAASIFKNKYYPLLQWVPSFPWGVMAPGESKEQETERSTTGIWDGWVFTGNKGTTKQPETQYLRMNLHWWEISTWLRGLWWSYAEKDFVLMRIPLGDSAGCTDLKLMRALCRWGQ